MLEFLFHFSARCRDFANVCEPMSASAHTPRLQRVTMTSPLHCEDKIMFKYGVAWLLGVPLGLLVVIYLLFHLF